jgi:hypothetical protein
MTDSISGTTVGLFPPAQVVARLACCLLGLVNVLESGTRPQVYRVVFSLAILKVQYDGFDRFSSARV